MFNRHLIPLIKNICFKNQKMALVSGPRQCGKTTLAKILLKERGAGTYHNWDQTEFRRQWTKNPNTVIPSASNTTPLIILDEIHKAKFWKRSLKGLFDTAEPRPDIIVTGSARLNVYKKGSDSLQGRYYHFRLHPLTIRELQKTPPLSPDETMEQLFIKHSDSHQNRQKDMLALLRFSGFPEPFLSQDDKITRLWRKGRTEKIIREDLRDLTRIPELSQIEMLVSLLPERIGTFVSRASLREDLEVSFDTVRRWLSYLKELYYIFEIKPYQTHIRQTLKKEGKTYLWDYTEIPSEAIRFENMVACHLLKFCHFWTDAGEGDFELLCLRNKRGQEIDFLICRNGRPWLPIEVKLNETTPSPNWSPFLKQLPCKKGVQIIQHPNHWTIHSDHDRQVLIASAADILPQLS